MYPSETEMQNLFSYGTLQLESVQLSTFGRRLESRADALVGYVVTLLPIRDEHVMAALGETHYRNIRFTGSETDVVEGMVLAVKAAELLQADEYEADADYQRVIVGLRSGLEAWVYLRMKDE